MILLLFVITITRLKRCPLDKKYRIRAFALLWCIFKRLRSMTTLFDCSWALRKLFSIVFLPLPFGLLISHLMPLASMSGVLSVWGRKKVTSLLKWYAKSRAADSSCSFGRFTKSVLTITSNFSYLLVLS